MLGFHLGLRPLRTPDDQRRHDREEDHEHDQQEREAPVQEQRERQQHQEGDEGLQVLPEEREPEPEQVVRPLQHHLQQASGVDVAVEGEGQSQHVLEEALHGTQPVAVGQAVGEERDQDVRDDSGQPHDAPEGEEEDGIVPDLPRRPASDACKDVHDLAEQDRLGEVETGQRQVGQRQRHRKAALGGEQGEHAPVHVQEFHGSPSATEEPLSE